MLNPHMLMSLEERRLTGGGLLSSCSVTNGIWGWNDSEGGRGGEKEVFSSCGF